MENNGFEEAMIAATIFVAIALIIGIGAILWSL